MNEILENIFSVAMIITTITLATPIFITAVGGLFSEITGVINIGLEGMMLMGAFGAASSAYYFEQTLSSELLLRFPYIPAFLGVICGMLVGALIAIIHAIISVTYKGNQTVSGIAINLFAGGFTLFTMKVIFKSAGSTNAVKYPFPKVPGLESMSLLVPVIWLTAILLGLIIYKTRLGLRMRAVGEFPLAADTVGISVNKIRYIGVILSGALAGMGGAYLSLGALDQFTKNMSAGRGFVALAALIFGKWNLKGIIVASLIFGFADAVQGILQSSSAINIPVQFIQMFPYIVTILALAGFVGRAKAPSAAGKPYDSNH